MSDRLHPSPFIRALLWSGGVIALILGIIGIFLPGLPTTPFILLTAACFVRASPRAYSWLLNHHLFGPSLRDWEKHHSIPRRAKIIALSMMAISVSTSLWYFSGRPWIQITIFLAAAIGAFVISRVPTRN